MELGTQKNIKLNNKWIEWKFKGVNDASAESLLPPCDIARNHQNDIITCDHFPFTMCVCS